MGKIIKFFTVLISLVLITAAVLVALLAFPVFGNQALIVRSGSMEPNIPVGSVVVVRPVESSIYSVGEVISFRRDANTIVTHRVVSVQNEGKGLTYKTKGDANEEEDGWTIKQKDVIGRSYFTLPEFGKFLAFAKSKYGFPILIIFPAIFVILVEMINIIREILKVKRKGKDQKIINNNESEYKINPDSYFTKRNFYALKVLLPIIAFGFLFQNTQAYFSDTEVSKDNLFQAASIFPTTSITPTPSISITPSPSISPSPTATPTPTQNLCDDINVDINGNGIGSHNGVIIICQNYSVVTQFNSTTVDTNININSNTGGNSSSGNTNGSSSLSTGSTNTNTMVVVTGGTNNNVTPTP